MKRSRGIMAVVIVALMAGSAFCAAPVQVQTNNGDFGDGKSKSIGWGGGTAQVLVSTQTAKWGNTSFLIKNWSNGYDLFIDTSTVISTSTAAGMDSGGFWKMGYYIPAGESIEIDGLCGQPWYGICPVSSTTVSILELRRSPAGDLLHLKP